MQPTLIAGLLAATVLAAPRLLPVDQASTRPDFFSFRAGLQRAIARHDVAALMTVVHPQIKNSFGGNDGMDEFRSMWKIDEPGSEIWDELGTVLALGGSFHDAETFVAPYVFSRWPDQIDSFQHVAVIGANVRVRSKPDTTSNPIEIVSFPILPVAREGTDKEGWTAVQVDKTVGYVSSAYVRSPIDYRAIFRFEDRRWRLVTFVAGD
jgi:hypothetical protein